MTFRHGVVRHGLFGDGFRQDDDPVAEPPGLPMAGTGIMPYALDPIIMVSTSVTNQDRDLWDAEARSRLPMAGQDADPVAG